jgi:hypothetical protein
VEEVGLESMMLFYCEILMAEKPSQWLAWKVDTDEA